MIKTRKIYLDLLRIIAAFYVIFNHAGEKGYLLFASYPVHSVQFWVCQMISIMSKVAVPIFFMISGALLLPRHLSIKDLYRKRIPRMCLVLFLFSFLYYIRWMLRFNGTFSIKEFVMTLYESGWNGPFWFLYAYLAFLISVPFLSVLAKNLDGKLCLYLIIIATFFQGILPVCEFVVFKGQHHVNEHFNVNWLLDVIILYPLLGYYFEEKFDNDCVNLTQKYKSISSFKGVLIGYLAVFFFTFVSCVMTVMEMRIYPETSQIPQTFVDCFVLIHGIVLFITMKRIGMRFQDKMAPSINRVIYLIGEATFGVYLLHMICLESGIEQRIWDFYCNHISHFYIIFSLLNCGCVFVICCVITMILKLIPGMKKLL